MRPFTASGGVKFFKLNDKVIDELCSVAGHQLSPKEIKEAYFIQGLIQGLNIYNHVIRTWENKCSIHYYLQQPSEHYSKCLFEIDPGVFNGSEIPSHQWQQDQNHFCIAAKDPDIKVPFIPFNPRQIPYLQFFITFNGMSQKRASEILYGMPLTTESEFLFEDDPDYNKYSIRMKMFSNPSRKPLGGDDYVYGILDNIGLEFVIRSNNLESSINELLPKFLRLYERFTE